VVNNTSTALGRRFLREKLLYPMTNENEIKKYYDTTEKITKKKIYEKIESELKEITDIERIERKMSLNILHPYELYELLQSYRSILKINKIIKKTKDLKELRLNKNVRINIEKFIFEIGNTYREEEIKKHNLIEITTNIFQDGKYPEIDELFKKINLGVNFMEKLGLALSKFIDEKKSVENKIQVKKNDRDGYYLNLTKLRATNLKKNLAKIKTIDLEGIELDVSKLEFKDNNNNSKIVCPDLQRKSDEVEKHKQEMTNKIKKNYLANISELYEKYKNHMKNVNSYVAKIDYIKSNAKTAILYNYKRPIIEENEKGYINAKSLRHPVIERIIDYEYIPHDISIGEEVEGMLLYGNNSSGKSILMKAVGISVIMAQAGMFVPAIEFKFSPYTSVYTRITGNDNLFKGLSSFALEMLELKAIMKRANKKTLVIGDEVCRGTEHVSGNSIVAASIINLSKVNASFIFATHLHELAKMERIKSISTIKAYHISVEYDSKSDSLIYDRKLKPGSGDELYGITVAKYILQDKEFIELANEIKNEILDRHNTMIPNKKSAYNSQLYVHECHVCGKKDIKTTLETHHINFQKDCDENDNVIAKPHLKKNDLANLVVLCNKCHDLIHSNKLEIKGTVMTSKGKQVITK
jgi:DNA mismatch repair protein MutS